MALAVLVNLRPGAPQALAYLILLLLGKLLVFDQLGQRGEELRMGVSHVVPQSEVRVPIGPPGRWRTAGRIAR